MEFIMYQEKPIEPVKVSVHQFKKGEEEGLCFSTGMWQKNPWKYSADYTPEEFERLRKVFGKAKKDLRYFVTINGTRVRPRHNEWIVLNENGDPIEALSTKQLNERYDKTINK